MTIENPDVGEVPQPTIEGLGPAALDWDWRMAKVELEPGVMGWFIEIVTQVGLVHLLATEERLLRLEELLGVQLHGGIVPVHNTLIVPGRP